MPDHWPRPPAHHPSRPAIDDLKTGDKVRLIGIPVSDSHFLFLDVAKVEVIESAGEKDFIKQHDVAVP